MHPLEQMIGMACAIVLGVACSTNMGMGMGAAPKYNSILQNKNKTQWVLFL
jgi:hypothetical protein